MVPMNAFKTRLLLAETLLASTFPRQTPVRRSIKARLRLLSHALKQTMPFETKIPWFIISCIYLCEVFIRHIVIEYQCWRMGISHHVVLESIDQLMIIVLGPNAVVSPKVAKLHPTIVGSQLDVSIPFTLSTLR